MKKVIVLIMAFVALGISAQCATKTITVTKTNGGENGYKYVGEKHATAPDGSSAHLLQCSEPGYEACGWTVQPSVLLPNGEAIPWGDLQDYALDQISQGILSGTYNDGIIKSGIQINRSVSWTATDLYNSNIKVNVEPQQSGTTN